MTQESFLRERVPLDCVVFPGMFSTERRVELKVGDQDYVAFVDAAYVTDVEEPNAKLGHRGRLWVKIRRYLEDAYVVALPEETLSTGELITVPKSMVPEPL